MLFSVSSRGLSVLASLLLVVCLNPKAVHAEEPASCNPHDYRCGTYAETLASVAVDNADVVDSVAGEAGSCVVPTGPGIPSGVDCDGCIWSEKRIAAAPSRALPPEEPAARTGGRWLYSVCFPEGQGAWIFVPDGAVPAPAVAAVVLAERARASFRLPLPSPSTSPPGATLVNLPTYLYVDARGWVARTATAAAGPTSVTVTAAPVRTMWATGEGGRAVSCAGPGRPYAGTGADGGACTYTYRRTSARAAPATDGLGYRASVQTVWQITWRCTGVCDEQAGTLAPLTPAAQFRVRVRQARSQLVSGR